MPVPPLKSRIVPEESGAPATFGESTIPTVWPYAPAPSQWFPCCRLARMGPHHDGWSSLGCPAQAFEGHTPVRDVLHTRHVAGSGASGRGTGLRGGPGLPYRGSCPPHHRRHIQHSIPALALADERISLESRLRATAGRSWTVATVKDADWAAVRAGCAMIPERLVRGKRRAWDEDALASDGRDRAHGLPPSAPRSDSRLP